MRESFIAPLHYEPICDSWGTVVIYIVYDANDAIICQCHTEIMARELVERVH